MGTKNLLSNGFVRDEDGRVACGTVANESVNGGAQTTLIHKEQHYDAKITSKKPTHMHRKRS